MSDKSSPSIIGGKFGLPSEPQGSEAPFLAGSGRSVFLANARSGIRLLVDQLRPRQVWLPSYLCRSMVVAARNGQADVKFYPVSASLCVEELSWLDDVKSGDIILCIAYFGFPSDPTIASQGRKRGAYIVEDASQALLSEPIGKQADFTLLSPRKFLGIPDGGILRISPDIELPLPELQPSPVSCWYPGLWATILRREYDAFGGSKEWQALFRESEANQPVGAFAMSTVSRTLLDHAFHYDTIRTRRVVNYQSLVSQLASISVYKDLPEGVVPLGCPVRLQNRDAVQQALFACDIYPPVHWHLDNVVPAEYEESHRLSQQVMTLPCDQRYSVTDMERIVSCVLRETEC